MFTEHAPLKSMPKFRITLVFLLCLSTLYSNADDAEILEQKTQIIVKNNSLITNIFYKIKINSPKGNLYSFFEFDYSKNDKIKNIKGKVTDVNGNTIHKLSKKDIKTSSFFDSQTFYSDRKKKYFYLKHSQYPYIIECSYTRIKKQYLTITHWRPSFNFDISTKYASLEITTPKDYQLKIRNNSNSEQILTEDKETLCYRWETNYEKKPPLNNLGPSINDIIPSIDVLPQNFKYIYNGNYNTWSAFGKYISKLWEDKNELPMQEKNNINLLTNGITDTVEITRILYHHLQDNCNYLNISIKYGGLDPYSAEFVSKNKYGDCKALSNYMKAMLEYKGISAYPVLVNVGKSTDKIDTNFVAQQFNHVIICVPCNNDSIWLECTSSTSPFNYAGAIPQNRKGLLINEDKSSLVNLPQIEADDVLCSYNYIFSDITPGHINAKLQFRLKGDNFMYIKQQDNYTSQKDMEDVIVSFNGLQNVKVTGWSISHTNRDTTSLLINSNVTCKSPANRIGGYIRINHPQLNIPFFEKPDKRNYPLIISNPYSQTDTIQYLGITPNQTIDSEPYEETKTDYGLFNISRKIKNDTLIIIRHIDIQNQIIDIQNYKQFYEFYSAAKDKNTTILNSNNYETPQSTNTSKNKKISN